MQQQTISQIVQMVRKRLKELGKERRVGLMLEDRDYRWEDGWLYLCVAPVKSGVRASDYAELMADIEKELREQHVNNVLLTPAINE